MTLLKNITEKTFKDLIKKSISKAQVIKLAGLTPQGANYRAFDILKKRWNVDTSHFLGKACWKNQTKISYNKIPLKDILTQNSTYQSNKLRKRLIKENIFEEKCNNCNNSEWLSNKIPLELEHKNGNKFDNRLENLELLCPNCHALTDTYRGKNINNVKENC